jgi:Flp pilus assembly protein TadD
VRRIQIHLANTFPDRPEAEFVNGLLKMELDDHMAVNDIESAILKDPKNAELLKMKALALVEMKDYEAAMRTVNRWVSLVPSDYLAYMCRGMVQAYQDDFLGAVNAFTIARDLNGDSAICHFALAIGLSELGREIDAKESLQRGLHIDDKSDLAEYAQGMVALSSGAPSIAVDHLAKAVQLNPGNGEFHFNLGVAYDRTGNHTAALDALSQAGQLGFGKAFELIREIKKANLGWIDDSSDIKTPWKASLKEAAREVLAAYDSDQMKPAALRKFANLKDASDQFFESHNFPKHPHLSKRGFYENVAKAKQ